MKLRIISEIQYKEASTSNERLSSAGGYMATSVNDQYHSKPSRAKKKSRRLGNNSQQTSARLDPLHSAVR